MTRSSRWSQAVGCGTRYVENKRRTWGSGSCRGRWGAANEPSAVPARPMCMKLRLVAALSVAVLAAGCGGARQVAQQSPAAPQSTPSTAAGPVFYAAVSADDGAVEVVSATTGKVLRRVAAAKRDGMSVAGVSRAGRDSLLVTYSRGPACSSGVAGCGPRPGTCGAEVLQVAINSGKATLLWRVGSDQLLRSAELSPDGKSLVALASPCVPSYFNDHLAVRRITDGHTWTIGASTPRCHGISRPHWTTDSAHVLLAYAPPAGKAAYTGSDGTCNSSGDSSLKLVDVTRPKPDITGPTLAPRPGCTWQASAPSNRDVYAIQACGPDSSRLDGPATLIQLSASLQQLHQWPIGQCTDGNSLAADPTQGVVLAVYLFCNPPPRGQLPQDPQTVLDRLSGKELRHVSTTSGGTLALDQLAW